MLNCALYSLQKAIHLLTEEICRVELGESYGKLSNTNKTEQTKKFFSENIT